MCWATMRAKEASECRLHRECTTCTEYRVHTECTMCPESRLHSIEQASTGSELNCLGMDPASTTFSTSYISSSKAFLSTCASVPISEHEVHNSVHIIGGCTD